ncbi:MAG: hypothetical protein ABI720_13715 [Actinomycetes bacterium]
METNSNTVTRQPRAERPAGTLSIGLAVVGGSLLVITPLLVELVAGDFILLLPIAMLASIASLFGLRLRGHSRLGLAFGIAFAAAFAAEVFEQSLESIPMVANVLPPVLFTASGLLLLTLANRARTSRRVR